MDLRVSKISTRGVGFASEIRPSAEQLLQQVNQALDFGYEHADIAADPNFQLSVKALLDEFDNELDMFAPSTQRRLKVAWGMYVGYCNTQLIHPLPSSPHRVCEYIEKRKKSCHRNTLNVDLWAIKLIHQATGCPDPTQSLKVRNKMRSVVRHKVRIEEETIKQATPLKEPHLDELTELWLGSEDLTKYRNLTLISVAYETLLRSAEIANIKLKHISKSQDGSGVLMIPFTKTNQTGEGYDFAYLSPFVMKLIEQYLHRIGCTLQQEGYLFSPISRFGCLRPFRCSENGKCLYAPLSTRTIGDIFLNAWYALNPTIDRALPMTELKKHHRPFTAHSARVGAAQDLLEKGFDDLQLRQAGRWKSNTMPSQYSQHIKVAKSAMALSRKERT